MLFRWILGQYFYEGSIKIPEHFDKESAHLFFESLKIFLSNEENQFIIFESSIFEQNQNTLRLMRKALDNNKSNAIKFSSIHSSQPMPLHDCHQSLIRIKSLISEAIKTDHKVILNQMLEHFSAMNNVPSRINKNGNIGAARSRRQGQVNLVRFKSREFDPLWSFALMECFEYNKVVQNLHNDIDQLIKDPYHQFDDIDNVTNEDRQRSITDFINCVENEYVPNRWLPTNSDCPIRLDQWMSQLHKRREMISNWLMEGYPGLLYLPLLSNPSGLIHALKEMYSMKTDHPMESLHCHYSLLDQSSLDSSDYKTLESMNHGCNVYIGDCYLHNSIYSDNQYSLDFLPENTTNTFGKVNKLCNLFI